MSRAPHKHAIPHRSTSLDVFADSIDLRSDDDWLAWLRLAEASLAGALRTLATVAGMAFICNDWPTGLTSNRELGCSHLFP